MGRAEGGQGVVGGLAGAGAPAAATAEAEDTAISEGTVDYLGPKLHEQYVEQSSAEKVAEAVEE